MDKRPSNFIILAILAIFAAGTVFVVSEISPSLPKVTSYTPREAKADPNKETTVDSPDGKMALTMKEEKGKEAVTYVFLISNQANSSQKEIFRETLIPGASISIPYNTFSPDNKYVFLKRADGGKDKYFVLSTAGTMLTEDSLFITFSDAFESKYPDYKITDVTGWGGLTLIVINTEKVGGGEGPSFWFDVASKSFIQLSSHFN